MPADIAAYIATDFDPTNDQFLELSALAARLVIPGAGDTIAAIVEKIAKLLVDIPDDLETVLKGEIGVGVSGIREEDDGESSAVIGSVIPAYAIVLHPTESGKARELVEDWFSEQVSANGGEAQRTQSGSVVVLRDPTVNRAESAAPAVVAFSGDYIFFGADYESLLPYIEAAQGNNPSLADSEDFGLLHAALPSERLLFGYADSSLLLDSAGSLEIASIPVSSIDAPAGPTAFTVAADDVGLRIESVSIPLDTDRELFDRDDDNPTFASRVPASTLAMYGGHDLGDSWLIAQIEKVLLSVLAGSLGADVDLSGFSIEDQFGFLSMLSGFNFKTDVFEQLEGDYGAALFSIDLEDPNASSAVIASNLNNPDIVQVAVTSLGPLIQSAGAGSASVTTSSVDDQTVHNVAVTTSGIEATIQYGVVDDQLMVGLGDGIETLTLPATETLDTSPEYQAALAELPDTYDSVVYVDTQAIADQLGPLLLESLAENSNNSIVGCLADASRSDSAVQAAIESRDDSGGSWIAETACSVLNRLLGGDGALLDFLVSRVPGPFAAVTYADDDLQHMSGILMFGSIDS